ncbi:MAG: BamA/TamA family outer membrane protein [Bacteroidota bacterium]|nr:BamA/TamA family outer membrane protein [Bacteroidota bacterium]
MNGIIPGKQYSRFYILILALFFLSGCATSTKYSGFTFVRKYQKNIPFVFKNNIILKAGDMSGDEKVMTNSRLNTQLDDSAKVKIKDVAFVFHYITRPPVFDTNSIIQSAENMRTSMRNIGYYQPEVTYNFDTVQRKGGDQKRVIINYSVIAGKRTLIDTLAYLFEKPELEELAISTKGASPLQKNKPITKTAIQDESNRLVTLYRNNGYYKFTADEIRVTGDTSIAALTNVSEDPFEQLRLLAEANQQRDKPTIRLGFQLNKSPDTTKLKKYFLNDIYVLPDYRPGDNYKDSSLNVHISNNYITKYHEKLFKFYLPDNNIYLKKGNVFRQSDYNTTMNNFYRLGVWESPTIDIIEKKDTNLIDLVIKLIPVKKYAFEGNIELSYSANSTTSNITASNSGNLLGIAGNLSVTNRNLAKEAVRMTNSIRLGVEFNASKRNRSGTFINSNELSYTNNIVIPKFIFPFKIYNRKKLLTKQSFVNTNISLVNRIDFFNQQIFNIGYGFNFTNKENHIWSVRLFNFDYHRLYNRSESFDSTIKLYPFLRYSFNTALVMGASVGYKSAHVNVKNPKIISTVKANLEESGLPYGLLRLPNKNSQNGNFFNKYLKEFIKADIEYTYTINHPKSAIVFRAFAGVGIPISKNDTTLPFFKQYFGGGPNSMRGWPVRGIGVGGQPLAPYVNNALFNDRTGDIQLEGNTEYRFNVAPLFSNAILFKMALFADVGNIWNFKNTKPDGSTDTTQFKFQNLYKQLGVSSGVGFRFDFSYFLIRFDVGFRFKRPDIIKNDGWQLPDISLSHLFGAGDANRLWRYENFNATIGIDYPF